MTDCAIEVVNLSKCYKIYRHPSDRLLEWILPLKTKLSRDFWALRNISLSISKGDAIGIIGANGAGKSTLLKIITGTSVPTEGQIHVKGRVAALLELGMGFHPELTGLQNIRMNGKLLGLTEEELDEKISDIVAFSELGEFVEQPLRTYSSGMYVRLGFSVAASINPDILIVDEALSVGDAHFQQKCIRRIKEIHEKGTTLLFVSHDPGAIRALCKEGILLEEGEIISRGDPDDILDHYNAVIAKRSDKSESFRMERISSSTTHITASHSGNFMAVITDAGILNAVGDKITAAYSGQKIQIYVKTFFLGDIDDPTIGFLIKDRLGNEVFGTNTYMLNRQLGRCESGESLEVIFSFNLNIGAGEYTLTAAANALEFHTHECYDWADKIFLFTVVPSTDFKFTGSAKCYPVITHHKPPTSNLEARNLVEHLFQDAPGEILMDLSFQKFLCKGWYDVIPTESGHIRWTDKEFAFVLRVKGEQLVMDIACSKPDIKTNPLHATITANGDQVGIFSVTQSHPHEISIILPKDLIGMIILFSITLSSSWKPSEYMQSVDNRELGILVRQIRTEAKKG